MSSRIQCAPIPGAGELMIPEFQAYLLALHDQFAGRVGDLREKRAQVVKRALHDGIGPAHLPPSDATTGDWSVPEVPAELREPGIEISGPASITSMFINALNPGPDGFRAQGDLDDDEDSAGHRLVDTLQAAANRKGAVDRTLTFYNAAKGKKYELAEGDLPFFMHRERGLHLDEPEVLVDGAPISASILGTALTLFHAGQAQAQRGQGIYFYLPKMESAGEAAFWRDFFASSQDLLPGLRNATIRAIALVESVPAAFQMEEILYALGEYAAGLNAARWDFKASILEYVMADPDSVWPDRFDVDIKTTDFLTRIFRRLVAICLKRGAVPIGGMATALPSRDAEVNQMAAEAIRADKQWEAEQGFLRGWVAHIFHMKTAADPFRELRGSGWTPSPEMARPGNYPIEIAVPEGPITGAGTRRNARMLLEYLEGWLNGRGAKGIDSLAGQPGKRPALMEDLATARISVAQIAQRVVHEAQDAETGRRHDFALVKRLLGEELESILELSGAASSGTGAAGRYRDSYKIALQWVRNYTELDFRSLGSYTRGDLARIAAGQDAF
ncbi:MAG: malate synthase A [Candidatus Aminicenantes bacterium]|nr:malate synthase A [Candidatus Aminicenantes bacterium]